MDNQLLDVQELQNYINGSWVEGESLTAVINPATGEEIVKVPLSDKEMVDSAVQAAKIAQKKWGLTPAPIRAEILYRVGYLMKERRSEEHTSELQSRGHLV